MAYKGNKGATIMIRHVEMVHRLVMPRCHPTARVMYLLIECNICITGEQ